MLKNQPAKSYFPGRAGRSRENRPGNRQTLTFDESVALALRDVPDERV
jgi:hypothetical protein